MLKNHIPPKYIRGLVVPNEEDKQALLESLRKAGRIEDRDGQEFITGMDKLAADFIHVSTRFQVDMWGIPEKDLPAVEEVSL